MVGKVLITGATGLIGRALTQQCLQNNIQVNYLTTRKDHLKKNPDLFGFYWNPKKDEIDSKAFEGVSVIVHLAGATVAKRWTKRYKRKILDSRIQGMKLIYKTLQNSNFNVNQFISASGIDIYPSSKTKLYSEEDLEVGDTFLAGVCVRGEAAANQFKDLGIDVAIIRTGMVLANEGGALPELMKPIKMGFGAALGSGEQWQSWIHVHDIAGIYLYILQNGHDGIYNAVAPTPVTNEKLVTQIAKRIQKPMWIPNIPGVLLKLVLGEMAVVILKGHLVSSRKIEGTGYSFKFYNLEAALQDLI